MSYRRILASGQPIFTEVHAAMTPFERFLFWLAVLNFVTFVVIALALGGDAINGSSQDGHYYLSEHGISTEVNRSVFRYSFIHMLSIFVTHPLGMVAAFKGRSRARRLSE